jgi:hypothetical protein
MPTRLGRPAKPAAGLLTGLAAGPVKFRRVAAPPRRRATRTTDSIAAHWLALHAGELRGGISRPLTMW